MILFAGSIYADTNAEKNQNLVSFYADGVRFFNMYLHQAREFLKPENSGKIREMEAHLNQQLEKKIKLTYFFEKFIEYADKKIFVPTGHVVFFLDSDLKLFFALQADIKIPELMSVIEKHLEKLSILPKK